MSGDRAAISEQGARQWLDRLAAEQNWRMSRVRELANDRRAELAELLALLAYSWNNDPDHVADIVGQDGWDERFANAAAIILETLT